MKEAKKSGEQWVVILRESAKPCAKYDPCMWQHPAAIWDSVAPKKIKKPAHRARAISKLNLIKKRSSVLERQLPRLALIIQTIGKVKLYPNYKWLSRKAIQPR